MILFSRDNSIIVRADYSPEIVQQFKRIPGAEFAHWEWSFPASSMQQAYEALKLKPGHMYPYLKKYVPSGVTPGVAAFYDGQKLILTGKSEHLDYLIENLQILCGYEEVKEEFVPGKGRVYNREFQTLLELSASRQGYVSLAYPKGLRYRVKIFLEWMGVPYKEKQLSELPKGTLVFPGQPKYPARYYQEAIADKAPHIRRATIVKPTGSGKTRTAGEIIRQLRLPALFLTDSKLLLNQTAKSLGETLRVPIGKVGAGFFDLQPVTVATVQTIRSILASDRETKLDAPAIHTEVLAAKEFFKGLEIPSQYHDKREAIINMLARTELLICDEAHGLGASAIYSVASLAEPALAFGLTATPQREDEHGIYMEAATGPIWRPINEQELIEKGFLLPVKVWAVPFKHGRTYRGTLRQMHDLKVQAIIENEKRNALLKTLAYKFQERYKTLLLVNEQEHARKLAEILGTTYITSETKSKDQENAIRSLQERRIKTLVSTPLLEQGVDIPEAELLIDGVPRKSVRRIIQAAGRIRRPLPGKTCAYIVTIIDLDDGIFEKQSARKLHILEQAGFEITYSKPVL